MAENKKRTIFQNLGNALFYGFDKNIQNQQKKIHSYNHRHIPHMKKRSLIGARLGKLLILFCIRERQGNQYMILSEMNGTKIA